MTERYLVTGGAGFIGSHVVRALERAGHQVTILDDFSTGHRSNLIGIAANTTVIEGDVRDLRIVSHAMQGVDVVLHQAALSSVPRSVADPLGSNDVNVSGTLNVLVASRDAGVRRVVYASSSSVYGDTPTLPKHEGVQPCPQSPYAASKLAGELYGRVFTHVYGLEVVCLRYFNVFGPRQDPHSQYAAVVPLFIHALLARASPTIYGDGEQTRGFTYVDDVVDANLLAATAPGVAGEVFNVAANERMSVNQLVQSLRAVIPGAGRVDPVYSEPRPGDVKHSYADTAKARCLLGYVPRVSVEEGLLRTVRWLQDEKT